MKTKTLLILSVISLGLITMSFKTEKESTKVSSTERHATINDQSNVYDGRASGSEISIEMANYPEPFINMTNIVYELPKSTMVYLYVRNLDKGTRVLLFEGIQKKGFHSIPFVVANQNSGKYEAELYTSYSADTELMVKLGNIGEAEVVPNFY